MAMAPPKRTLQPHEARERGIKPLTSFFSVIRKRGRPKKKGNLASDDIEIKVARRGRPSSKSVDASKLPKAAPAAKGKRKSPPDGNTVPVKPPAKRTNWSKGPNKVKLEDALLEWNSKTGRHLDGNGEPRTLFVFSMIVGIPYSTLKKYVCGDDTTRRSVGMSAGRKPLVDETKQNFLKDTLIRHDRGNDGKSPSETIDVIQELVPGLDRKQAAQAFHRTIRPKISGAGGIKPRPVKSQGTTTKRSAITISQQYRWHKSVEKALDFLRRENTGVCRKTGKTFGELVHHFIVGGDETCFQASDSGDCMVVAAHGKIGRAHV